MRTIAAPITTMTIAPVLLESSSSSATAVTVGAAAPSVPWVTNGVFGRFLFFGLRRQIGRGGRTLGDLDGRGRTLRLRRAFRGDLDPRELT